MSPVCPFCQPDAGNIVFQTPEYLALWDAFPVTPGHALIVPRRHVANWFEATREEHIGLLEGIERAKCEITARYKPAGFNIGVNIGAEAGQTIFHLHVHLIPRYGGDVPDPRGGVRNVIPHKGNYLRASVPGADFLGGAPHNRSLIRGDTDPLLPHLLALFDRAVAADLCVAFVQLSGIRLVEGHLRDFLARGGRLRLLTGDYLDISDPEALFALLDLDGNIQLRVFEARNVSFHRRRDVNRARRQLESYRVCPAIGDRVELSGHHVSRSGHDIPDGVQQRRFGKGIRLLAEHYRTLIHWWRLYDNTGESPHLVAQEKDGIFEAVDAGRLALVEQSANVRFMPVAPKGHVEEPPAMTFEEETRASLRAMRKAFADVVLENKAWGLPVIQWRRGVGVVEVPPEQLEPLARRILEVNGEPLPPEEERELLKHLKV